MSFSDIPLEILENIFSFVPQKCRRKFGYICRDTRKIYMAQMDKEIRNVATTLYFPFDSEFHDATFEFLCIKRLYELVLYTILQLRHELQQRAYITKYVCGYDYCRLVQLIAEGNLINCTTIGMIEACTHCNNFVVKELIRCGVTYIEDGLYYASLNGHDSTVRYFMMFNPRLAVLNRALLAACSKGQSNVAHTLLMCGADNIKESLVVAEENRQNYIVKMLTHYDKVYQAKFGRSCTLL